ncbi:MAG: serine/threonine protein kinase, partial [Deltaproteobacteria bacterium]|nr:serine/threonine protein kinase [Deltaproteobacteria bacterium]
REIYHLDLKPENLFLSRTRTGEDFIKVLDYGLVKLIEQRDQEALSGYLSSSPYYLSPEQIRGVEVDARSDIYSLGALLFRMVTGTPPYTARTALGVLQQHLDAEVPDPCAFTDPPLHPEVRRVLQRALAKHPELRYPSMDAFRVDLQAAVDRIKADELPLKLAARQGTGPSPRASQQLAPGENGGPAAGAERLAEEGGGSGLSAGEAASFSRWDTRHEERVPGELLGTRQDILGFQTRLAQRGLLQSWGTLLLMAATLALAGLAWWWLMRS